MKWLSGRALYHDRMQKGYPMAERVNVAVDAMGGDNAPVEVVKGAVDAVNADKRVKVFSILR